MSDDPRQLRNAMASGQQPDIFELNVDCFEELFDWLPLADLHAISQTCTRLQRYAGYVFRETYPGAHVECKNGGIFIGDLRVDGFCDFIENLSLRVDNLECFRFIKSNQFKSLKRIELNGISLNEEKMACIKHILMKGAAEQSKVVEDIQISHCTIEGEFFGDFLQYCPHIKRLSLTASNRGYDSKSDDDMDDYDDYYSLIGKDNSWLHRKYPKLEYFALGNLSSYFHGPSGLGIFFKKNPNIRKFAVDLSYYQLCDIAVLGLEVDDLAIICHDFESEMYYNMYKTLPEMKFFKRFQLYKGGGLPLNEHLAAWADRYEEVVGVDKLKDTDFSSGSSMCMANLKTLCIEKLYQDIDDVCELTQLESVSIEKVTPVEMDTLISHLPNLKIFTVTKIENGNDDGSVDIDLMKWNRERERLVGARKIRVYVPEAIYLEVKWVTRKTNYNLVELKRLESYEWDHDFAYPPYY